jgi:hypothetical protein
MGYLGYKPADKPLTAADITDSIITSAKITDATIVNGDIANATIALAKLSATGTPSAATFLRGDNAWGEAGAAAGQVIQVLSAYDSTERSTNSASYVTASNTLSVSITPSSTSNKILILVNHGVSRNDSGTGAYQTIFRGSTNLGDATFGFASVTGAGLVCNYSYLDSPATTSATTYQVRYRSGTNLGYFNKLGTENDTGQFRYYTASITVMEIKG